MDVCIREKYIALPAEDFEPALVFNCGQCFRWNLSGGVWRGVAYGRALVSERLGDEVRLYCSREDFDAVWLDYFDLSRDYAALRRRISKDGFTAAAAEYGRGIRLLRQEFFETLCSFIFSQCNNIPRIKGIVSKFCEMFGSEVDGSPERAFPAAEMVAGLTADDLAALRCGYRAPYIIAAARAVAEGRITPGELRGLSTADALSRLRELPGVGEKVASCVLLYGAGKPDAFPIDVWMRRALREHYPPGFDGSEFGGDAGVAQQYIFHYVRHLAGVV